MFALRIWVISATPMWAGNDLRNSRMPEDRRRRRQVPRSNAATHRTSKHLSAASNVSARRYRGSRR